MLQGDRSIPGTTIPGVDSGQASGRAFRGWRWRRGRRAGCRRGVSTAGIQVSGGGGPLLSGHPQIAQVVRRALVRLLSLLAQDRQIVRCRLQIRRLHSLALSRRIGLSAASNQMPAPRHKPDPKGFGKPLGSLPSNIAGSHPWFTSSAPQPPRAVRDCYLAIAQPDTATRTNPSRTGLLVLQSTRPPMPRRRVRYQLLSMSPIRGRWLYQSRRQASLHQPRQPTRQPHLWPVR